jgi:hypothetical protein
MFLKFLTSALALNVDDLSKEKVPLSLCVGH